MIAFPLSLEYEPDESSNISHQQVAPNVQQLCQGTYDTSNRDTTKMWTCIAFTCSNASWAKVLRQELEILQKQNLLDCPQYLVVEDPASVGSGGAVLNTLLVIAETLCQTKGYNTLSPDVLNNSHILIVQHGNPTCYWSSDKSFFPSVSKCSDDSGSRTQLEETIHFCMKLKNQAPPGVWIVSSDYLRLGTVEPCSDWSPSPNSVLFTVKCQQDVAEYCGIVRCDSASLVREITYRIGESETVDVPAGILFLYQDVVEALLSIHWKSPLDLSTYLGEDNGEPPLCLSLYFDILGPLCTETKESFLSGTYGVSSFSKNENLEVQAPNRKQARKILWEHLSHFQLVARTIRGLDHHYWSDQLPLERIFSSKILPPFLQSQVSHSALAKEQDCAQLVCLNSSALIQLGSSHETVLICSQIKSSQLGRRPQLRGRAYFIAVSLDLDQIPGFYLADDAALVGHWISIDNRIKQGLALFSSKDVPTLEYGRPEATYFGLPWQTYLERQGIQADDLWPAGVATKSLMTAKLFPIVQDITSWRNLLWLQDFSAGTRLKSWRNSVRYSLADFISMNDPRAALDHFRTTRIACSNPDILLQWKHSLIPHIRRACAEGWTDHLLSTLDSCAIQSPTNSRRARFLAAIADLLACAAGRQTAVRSGPACNKEWNSAFDLFENVSTEEGIAAMARQRAKWMDTPERLIRAARHYERAVHLLIRQSVQSVESKMAVTKTVESSRQPPIGTLIQVECPARIDLSGGWSDTPPICYEMGGSVVNVAISVDEKKPIGATGRRIPEFQLVLISEGQTEPLILTSLDQVLNYCNPTASGALLKASLVCAGVIRPNSSLGLQEQLQQTLGSGLELHGWSLLPQGSGLGTSSILAAALLTVIYTAMGVSFNRLQLIHAVLYIEQLLTTGGGWQDQVGGVMGGCNRGYSPADTDIQVHVESLPLPDRTIDLLDRHLILMHTGKVRLARNLLQNVIRQWYACDESIVSIFHQLVANALDCKAALLQGDMKKVGDAIDTYWAQKKEIAPGSQPSSVGRLMDLLRPFVFGQSLTGAGGGGFYFALLKDPGHIDRIKELVSAMEGGDNFSFHSVRIDRSGVNLKVGQQIINIP